jgi:MscS family membrane protein
MSQLTWWTVLELVLAAVTAYVGGLLAGKGVQRLLYRFAVMTHSPADDKIVMRLGGPLVAICAVVIWQILTTIFDLPSDVLASARTLGSIALLVALAWAGMRLLDGAIEMIAMRSRWITSHRVSQSLLPLARRLAKVVLAVIVIAMILAQLGYAVGPLLVGLGIAAIAIALAAQKTLENVFGAYAIGVDHPFHEGDLIRLDNGLVATVEAIGLRSTRLRTQDKTMVAIPNGKLADAQVEALTAQDRMRFATTLHLALGAPTANIESALADLTDMLSSHPRRAADDEPSVHVTAISDAWIEVEVVASLATTSWDDFVTLRERLLLRCLDLVSAAGLTLHNAPAPPAAVDTMRSRTSAAR